MKTTALFAEVLVVGLVGLVWLVLLLMILPGLNVNVGELLKLLSKHSFLSGVLLTALAYCFGVMIDRIADIIFDDWDHRRIRKKHFDVKEVKFTVARMKILHRGGDDVDFLHYQRSRIRIARASVLNFILIALTASILLFEKSAQGASMVLLLGFVLTLATLYSWHSISRAYYRRLGDAYRLSLIEDEELFRKFESEKRAV
jgi:hypothetical protein